MERVKCCMCMNWLGGLHRVVAAKMLLCCARDQAMLSECVVLMVGESSGMFVSTWLADEVKQVAPCCFNGWYVYASFVVCLCLSRLGILVTKARVFEALERLSGTVVLLLTGLPGCDWLRLVTARLVHEWPAAAQHSCCCIPTSTMHCCTLAYICLYCCTPAGIREVC